MLEFIKSGIPLFSSSVPMYILGAVICAAVPYLLGSMNFGLSYSSKRKDGETGGHGGLAVLAAVADIFKALLSAAIGFFLMPYDQYAYVGLLFCMLGHAFPLFFGFKGTDPSKLGFFACAFLNPIVFIIFLVLYFLTILLTSFRSAAVIICAVFMPVVNMKLYMWFLPLPAKLICSALCGLLVLFCNRSAIGRLLSGKEEKTYLFKRKKDL